VGGVPCPPISALIVILQAMEIAPRAAEAEGLGEKASSAHPAAKAARSPALRAGAAAFARSAKEAARSKSEAKVDRLSGRYDSDRLSRDLRGTASRLQGFGRKCCCAPHSTANTKTSAHLAPCGGTATKYSFNAGTSSPVLPSGPVGTFPMALKWSESISL
jgi:hypothetical protein